MQADPDGGGRDDEGPVVDAASRVVAIERYDVLNRPPRGELLAIVELAAQVTRAPMATINLITHEAQHQVATVGFEPSICRREDSLCAAVLQEKSPVVVPDTRLDPRFRDNPFVTGQIGRIRFYASHRLVSRSGVVIGTLCVFDEQPRTLDEEQQRALGVLAERIVDVLELALRERQLAASNERLSAFAGRVSHDLKTPLTSVSMTLQLIQEQLEAAEPSSETGWLIEKALKGADRMASLIDSILAHTTVEGTLTHSNVGLNEVVTDVLVDLGTELAGVATSIHDLPIVVGDEVQLRSVLRTLVANSAKHRSPTRPLRIEIGAERRDQMWRIRVADNGIGIPPEHRIRVLESGARVGDEPGPGGLGAARQAVEAHGGTIGVQPGEDGGTVVWFEIPV